MKNQHKKSRDYLNMDIPLEELAAPKTTEEKARYAQRIDKEWAKLYDDEYRPDSIYYEEMTDKERREDDKRSHDYLNPQIDFDSFGRPRTKAEIVLFRRRYDIEYLYDEENFSDCDDDEEDEYLIKVVNQQGNIVTDLEDPFGLNSKGHRYYLDMEHPLTFDYFDVPSTNLELDMYNQRVELDPNLTEADKLIGIPWPDHPTNAYNEETGEWEMMHPDEVDGFRKRNAEIPDGTYKIIGLGSCGCQAVELVALANIRDTAPVAMDTDRKMVMASRTPRKRWLKIDTDDNSDAPKQPSSNENNQTDTDDENSGVSIDDRAVFRMDNEQTIRGISNGGDTMLISLGLGGYAGAKMLPLLLSIAKEDTPYRAASHVVGMAMFPFSFERDNRRIIAENSLRQLEEKADVMFLLPGDTLLSCAHRDFPMLSNSPLEEAKTPEEAFQIGARVLGHCTTAMATLLAAPEDPEMAEKNRLWKERHCWGGCICEWNEKPEDEPLPEVYPKAFGPNAEELLALMKHCKRTSPGIGEGKGENAVKEAAERAVASPLLGDTLSQADTVLVHVLCNPNQLDRSIVSTAVKILEDVIGRPVKIFSGASDGKGLGDVVRVTIFAIVPDKEKRAAMRLAKIKEERRAKNRQNKKRFKSILRCYQKFGKEQ